MVTIRESRITDVYALHSKLRSADLKEIRACSQESPLVALRRCYKSSELCWTVCLKGEVIGMFGAVSGGLISTKGVPWFLGSDKVMAERRSWVKNSKKYLSIMLKEYTVLTNYVSADNRASKIWLKWMGFTLYDAEPFGFYKELFNRFEIRR